MDSTYHDYRRLEDRLALEGRVCSRTQVSAGAARAGTCISDAVAPHPLGAVTRGRQRETHHVPTPARGAADPGAGPRAGG